METQSAIMNRSGACPEKERTKAMAHIVVVDDEADLRDTLREYLEIQGFKVTCAEDAAALRAVVAEPEAPIDLVLLDISMPGEDGLSVARFLRETSDVAIIMLTAAGSTVDKIIGLEVGADDYLAKPVDLREMLAHIKAVLRRAQRTREASTTALAEGKEALFGRCRLDLDSHKLYAEDGSELPLTSMEFDLLRAFAEHPNRVLTRDQLLEWAHNRNWDPFDRSIDIRIARIRKKIEPDPAKPQVIKTVRGAGYLYATKATAETS
jgi:two-component system phosphate regulon response regulator OmpR